MNLIVALCKSNNGIGNAGKIRMIKNDLKNFQQITIKTFKPHTKKYGSYGKKNMGITAI